MRYPRDHNKRARSRIVSSSAAVAKRHGFNSSGIDALAAAAGVTSGSFYKHFSGKDALLSAIIETELSATERRFANVDPLQAIDAYLSLAHVAHPELGCPLPALAQEVARASHATRVTYETALGTLTDSLATSVGDRASAQAVIALCVGAVTIARGLATDAARRELLATARTSARALVRSARG